MDYGSLLQLAKKNADQKKEVKRSALPSLPPARTAEELIRQELEKKKLLDANVARFLSKKKEEEERKLKAANKKRGELLSIRNLDSKARKRVKIMNKSAKSADKSAIEDAVGPSDYYVIEEPLCFMSQESLAQEEKFLENLCKGQAEEKFPKGKANTNRDLNSTKARVQLALQLGDTFGKEKSREPKEKSSEKKKEARKGYHSEDEPVYKEEEKPRKRQPAPPPMNYHELLLLAEKLQQEPIREPSPEKETILRPMTAKQREIYLYEEASRKRKEAGWKEEARLKKLGKLPPLRMDPGTSPGRIPKVSTSAVGLGSKEEKTSFSIPRIPKLNGTASTNDKKIISSSGNAVKLSSQENKTSSFKHGSNPMDRPRPSKQSENSNRKPSVEPQSFKQSSNHTKSTPRPTDTSSQINNKIRATESTNMSGSKPSLKYSSTKISTRETSDSPRSSKEAKSRPSQSGSNIILKKEDREPRPTHPTDLKIRKLTPSETKTHTSSRVDEKTRPKPKQSLVVEARSKQLPNSLKSAQYPRSDTSTAAVMKPRPKLVPTAATQSSLADNRARKLPPRPTENQLRQTPSSSVKTPRAPSPDIKPRQVLSSNAKSRQLPLSSVKPRQIPLGSDVKARHQLPTDARSRQISSSDVKSRQFPGTSNGSRQFPPSDVKPRQFPPSDVKSRQFPPSDVKSRQFPPADMRSRQFPPNDIRKRPQAPPKRRIIESDEEYDSEDADFIEDDPEDGAEDYSKYIKEIFGYDKSRYRGQDEDDRNMESSFQQQLKEEFTSTKLGLLEDLEDIQKEKKQALLKKKRKLK